MHLLCFFSIKYTYSCLRGYSIRFASKSVSNGGVGIFQPIYLRGKHKYRSLSHHIFLHDEILDFCIYLDRLLVTPQLRGRYIKSIAKRQDLSHSLIKSWYYYFKTNKSPFLLHAPVPLRIIIKKIPYVRPKY